MMGDASLSFLYRVSAGLVLLGLVWPAAARAAEQGGWATVVETKSEAMLRQMRSLPDAPPRPRKSATAPAIAAPLPKPKALAAPAPAANADVPALVPVDEADITTGNIDAENTDRMLSPGDSARLFAEDGDVPAGELTTGTVDGQGSDLAHGYCVAIAAAAADARTALQMTKLAQMEKQITGRIAALEAKTAEYKSWVERRDEFLKRATSSLVKIYTTMEPDAAALHLVSMAEETAASLLMKLEPQNASAILNEMAPEKAARLAATISGAARLPRPMPPAAPAAPPRPSADAPKRV